jgi:hypothetical protein
MRTGKKRQGEKGVRKEGKRSRGMDEDREEEARRKGSEEEGEDERRNRRAFFYRPENAVGSGFGSSTRSKGSVSQKEDPAYAWIYKRAPKP